MFATLRMEAYDAYRTYLALKSHFTLKSYDYFQYKGAVRAKRETFERRRDKYFFHKLAKHKDLVNFLVALFAHGQSDMWVGDMVRNEEYETMYIKWKRVTESITHVFRDDLEQLNENFASNFEVPNGQHPHLLKLVLRGTIHIETFIILNVIVRFSGSWNKHIQEKVIWPEIRHKCKKYQPFLSFDADKCKKILVDFFDLKEV
jgi:T4 gene Gp59 loader of gp41 DNA helicase/T4 gene Gp59 loader of gp41 DNA helicase C-term